MAKNPADNSPFAAGESTNRGAMVFVLAGCAVVYLALGAVLTWVAFLVWHTCPVVR